jgi:glycosyltransferase involved in cell wall biosynthesis
MLRINIQFPFDKHGGGGNQFLKALKRCFTEQNIYENSPSKADVILFNSHHEFDEVFSIRKEFPDKLFIHRVDGPIHLARGRDRVLDNIILKFNDLVADGTIFQSHWSRECNRKSIGFSSRYETVIFNAPDNDIFNPAGKTDFHTAEKIKLVSSSNSSNMRKGFEIYDFLDKNMDFSRYEMTFIGNSPIKFNNITWIKPVSSGRLAAILKESDIYIFASRSEACSNSLIEALSCGLPAVAINSSSNPELIGECGELFDGTKDVINKIDNVVKNYHSHNAKIPEFRIERVARQYYEFASTIYHDVQKGLYQPKRATTFRKIDFYSMKSLTLLWKGFDKFRIMRERTWKQRH